MLEETALLVKAIDGLKQDPNYFKDYAFPIASAFFTSILGAGIAYLTLKRQEGVQIEKDKLDAANKWILVVENAIATLFAIKVNYHGQLSDTPLQRLSAIPSILFHASPVVEKSYQELSFIVPSRERNQDSYHKWSQIPRIRAMISNYNYVLKLWEKRNDLNQQFKEQLLNHHGDKAYVNLSLDNVVAASCQANFIILVDLTEQVVKLTDDLIIELNDFLSEFPSFAKTKIQVKRLKRYGSIMTHSNDDNKKLLNLLVKSPNVDFSSVEQLFGTSSEDIKKRHATGYE